MDFKLWSNTEVIYFTTQYYNQSKETGINIMDSNLKIKLPLKISKLVIKILYYQIWLNEKNILIIGGSGFIGSKNWFYVKKFKVFSISRTKKS